MVVRLRTGRSIRGALSYNERKVSQGKADLLLAVGFSCEIEKLGFSKKLGRFQALMERNEAVKTNTLHLSVNFPPEEAPSDETMRRIAMGYMERIGFGEQPFLVYKHKDANHSHIHIVTTNIQADSTYISFHNLGKDKSEPARKAIEKEFGLIQAQTRKQSAFLQQNVNPLLAAEYGRSATKQLITNGVGEVVRSYKFSSLVEFNAILKDFNIVADRGLPDTKRYQQGGLLYSLLDKDGCRIGVPIKASDIYGEPPPTLKNLQRRFAANAVKKAGLQVQVKKAIELELSRCQTIRQFTSSLRGKGIRVQADKDRLGIISQVRFVDHCAKVTFSNGELNISLNEMYRLRAEAPRQPTKSPPKSNASNHTKTEPTPSPTGNTAGMPPAIGIIQAILQPDTGSPGPAGDPPKKKKKKRRQPYF